MSRQTPTQYQSLEVIEPRARLIAPHSEGKLTFLHPPYGPDTYAHVGLAIVQDNLKKPTMAETASLVHAAFNSGDRYSDEIKGIMRQACLWAFTGILYVPNEGAFIQDDPEISDGIPFMDRTSLEQKLNAEDPSVRHVPFGYKVGEMSPSELAKNPYVIALAGEEGAEKLARVAEKFRNKPRLFSFKSVEKPQIRVSALGSGDLDYWLYVLGDFHGDGRGGRAFGVFEKTQK